MSIYGGPASSLLGGNKVVTAAGTQERLVASSTPCAWVVITAAPANTGKITIGDSSVDATADAENGVTLEAGASFTVPINDATNVWLDATVSGDEVGYLIGKVSA